jgi:hypothetical protein
MGEVVAFPGKKAKLRTYHASLTLDLLVMDVSEQRGMEAAMELAERIATAVDNLGVDFPDPAFVWHGETE